MVVNRWTKTFALGGTYMIPPWPTHARERLFRDNCFSYTRELRLLMNIFYIKRNAVDTGRTSIMHLNWPWIGVPLSPSISVLLSLSVLDNVSSHSRPFLLFDLISSTLTEDLGFFLCQGSQG